MNLYLRITKLLNLFQVKLQKFQANFFEKYNKKKDQLGLLMKKWEVVAEELMEFES